MPTPRAFAGVLPTRVVHTLADPRFRSLFPQMDFQSSFSATESKHSFMPQVETLRPMGVVSLGMLLLILLNSKGSMPAASASWSMLLSMAQATCGFPYPRMA